MSKRRLRVRGAIENMPAKFDLNVEPLNRDDSILIRDVEVPTNCRMMDRPDVAICGVIKAK
jgi:large subunit ribosomal protein L25